MCVLKSTETSFHFWLTEEIAEDLQGICERGCKRGEHVESNALKALKRNIFRIIKKTEFHFIAKRSA